MDKPNVIYLGHEYYSTIKKHEVPRHAIIWMNLKNFILNERSQSQKITCCVVPLTGNVQNRQIHGGQKVV